MQGLERAVWCHQRKGPVPPVYFRVARHSETVSTGVERLWRGSPRRV